jgi:PPOX class probable F420-dependent enzyme
MPGSSARRRSLGGLAVGYLGALNDAVVALLRAKNVCVVSTSGDDGVIHTRAVWVDTDGDHVIINSVGNRVWVRDLQARPAVTCTIVNLANAYEYVSIEGTVVECSSAGAESHIDALAQRYIDVERYPFHSATEPRLKIVVRPDRILYVAPDDQVLVEA